MEDQTHTAESSQGVERAFLTYVRTLQFMKTRLRGIDESSGVHINQTVIEREFFIYPKYNRRESLQLLIETGKLEVTEKESETTGRKMKQYRALEPGSIDLTMIKPETMPDSPGFSRMKEYLQRVTLRVGTLSTPYFDAFLKYKDSMIDLFFTVDKFAGRVHTPVVNFHRTHRPNILIDGQPTASLDVATMQPLLLGKILLQNIGTNDLSTWINEGKDVYILLQELAKLEDRDQGKKRFFEILFSHPSERLADIFGRSNWIEWINWYKSIEEPRNDHRQKKHTNLAWLLQSSEVTVMKKVWRKLIDQNVAFLSIHDEIIVKESDIKAAEMIFSEVMEADFQYFKLNTKFKPAPDPCIACPQIEGAGIEL